MSKDSPLGKQVGLIASIITILGFLGVSKYTDFFESNSNSSTASSKITYQYSNKPLEFEDICKLVVENKSEKVNLLKSYGFSFAKTGSNPKYENIYFDKIHKKSSIGMLGFSTRSTSGARNLNTDKSINYVQYDRRELQEKILLFENVYSSSGLWTYLSYISSQRESYDNISESLSLMSSIRYTKEINWDGYNGLEVEYIAAGKNMTYKHFCLSEIHDNNGHYLYIIEVTGSWES